MSLTCKYCIRLENKQHHPGLVCEICKNFVHLSCLRSQNTPGNLAGDVFFDFTCEDCSPDRTELLKRNKFQWVNVLVLTMNHLQNEMQGISNRGFFHYKTHICSFIDRYWLVLFGPSFKRTKNWMGTIVGALSLYNSLFFRSGSTALGELGWWKLMHSFSPAVAAHIVQELGKDKPKRIRNQIALDIRLFNRKVIEMGYGDFFDKTEHEFEESMVGKNDPGQCKIEPGLYKNEPGLYKNEPGLYNNDPGMYKNDPGMYKNDPVPCKKPRFYSDDYSAMSSSSTHEFIDSDTRNFDSVPYDSVSFAKDTATSEGENIFHGFDFTPTYIPPSDSSSVNSYKPQQYDSDSPPERVSDDERSQHKKLDRKKDEKVEFRRESLFSTQLNSTDLPWEEKEPEADKDLVELTEYEEVQLLKSVENLLLRVREPGKRASLHRLKAKLALRRRKRHNHLPVFDIDRAVKLLGGYLTDDQQAASSGERILDRFQRSYLLDSLCGTVASSSRGPLLLSHTEPAALRSAYSGALLKPYIRRDATSMPTWLKLTDELLRKTNRWPADQPIPRGTVDYSYVQPHHIAALNSLCAQFFWPGIDLTEALQYPEFSCVVTYKKLIVGCAFLVPDVRPTEAYISFVFTRPEWRNAKIASFMLYHLLQTCAGKDVTLHVSPTNPAIFLYQKFGFKVEELVQDFYEKYYDIDYKGCRHALFLRLTR